MCGPVQLKKVVYVRRKVRGVGLDRREDSRETSTLVGVCVHAIERERGGGRYGLASLASSPMLALHGLAHTPFGIRGDIAGYWTKTGLSCEKRREGVCNGCKSGMGFISIKNEAKLSPLYDPLQYIVKL